MNLPKQSPIFIPCLILSVFIGIAIRFLFLTRHELWYDEVLSVLLSSGQRIAFKNPEAVPIAIKEYTRLLSIPADTGLVETLKNLLKGILGDPHPPLFYLGQHLWMRSLGNGVAAMRSLVVLSSLGAIAGSYGLGRLLLGRKGGWLLAALMALNPFFLSHSLNLRMYTLLVLWAVLGEWSLLALIKLDKTHDRRADLHIGDSQLSAPLAIPTIGTQRYLLMAALALCVAAGLMSQYLFAYSLLAMAVLVLTIGRRHWFQYGLTLTAGVVLTLPWVFWGTRQQAKNRSDVLSQISEAGGWLTTSYRHLQDIAQTLANHLLLGHWSTGFLPIDASIKPTAVAAGFGVMIFLLICLIGLYRQREYYLLTVGFILGLLPLLIALGLDIATHKFTVGFGWGRSVMVALPGCLLLIASWLSRVAGRWQMPLSLALLTLYLAVGVGDFTLRDRNMFHTVNDWVIATPNQSTLVVMNSRAWGNVLRLSYYIDPNYPADMLATHPRDLPDALPSALQGDYDRVLWLNAQDPVWSVPKTEAETQQIQQAIETTLASRYQLIQRQSLSGTMDIDAFELSLYE
ncbi:MAG: glycosyltransferase family 39 protein [Cyanobacteria bacterium J06635_1]